MDHELHRRGSFLLPVRRLWSVGNEGSFQSPSTRTGYLTMLDTSRYILSDCSGGLRTSDLPGDSRSRTRSAGVHHHRSRSNLAALVEHAPKSSLEQGSEVAEAHLDGVAVSVDVQVFISPTGLVCGPLSPLDHPRTGGLAVTWSSPRGRQAKSWCNNALGYLNRVWAPAPLHVALV